MPSVGTEREYWVGDRGPFLVDDGLDYLDADGNPTGILMRGGRFPNIYLDLDPGDPREAVPLAHLSAGYVPVTRQLATTLPLRIDGGASADLSADRTFSIPGLSSIGTANYLVGVNSGATAWEYKQLLGTANQVSIAYAAGSVTLSLPQEIHTGASPTFDDLTINGNAVLGDDPTADVHIIHGDLDIYIGVQGIVEIYDTVGPDLQFSFDSSGNLTCAGNAIFDGGDIGITSDTDLIQMAANVVTVNGSIYSTSVIHIESANPRLFLKDTGTSTSCVITGNNGFLQLTAITYVQLTSGGGQSQYYDAGGTFYWRDVDAAYATRMTLNSATGLLTVTGDVDSQGDVRSNSDATAASFDAYYYFGADNAAQQYLKWSNDAADNRFAFSARVYVAGTFKVHQTNATLGTEAMIIDQDDEDKAFTDYQGTSEAGYTKNISTGMSGGASGIDVVAGPKIGTPGWIHSGMVKMEINGGEYWMPYYTYTP